MNCPEKLSVKDTNSTPTHTTNAVDQPNSTSGKKLLYSAMVRWMKKLMRNSLHIRLGWFRQLLLEDIKCPRNLKCVPTPSSLLVSYLKAHVLKQRVKHEPPMLTHIQEPKVTVQDHQNHLIKKANPDSRNQGKYPGDQVQILLLAPVKSKHGA